MAEPVEANAVTIDYWFSFVVLTRNHVSVMLFVNFVCREYLKVNKEKNSWAVSISSPPDRNNLVADVMINNEQMLEVNNEDNTVRVEIYERQDGEPWVVPYEKLVELLAEAKEMLESRS